jgi:type IV secretion system pilin
MIKHYIYKFSPVIVTAVGFIFAAVAAQADIVSAPTGILTSPNDVANLFCSAALWMFWLLIVFSVIMFLVGGFTYATSQGDAEKVSKATKTLTYAAIGVVVALVAAGVPVFIDNVLGGGNSLGNVCNTFG